MDSPSVLVADDQPDILQALRLLLSDAGIATDLANSADAVLARVQPASHDLLLMDLNYSRDTTSGREGLDLIERVRARDPGLPIVVMTGWGSIDTAVEAMRRGAKSFVQKPWEDATLVSIVQREIAEGRATRRADAEHARELEEAQLIQRTLLPASLPAIPGCDLDVQWTPASGIGGDCYDVLRFGDTRVGLAIADVIGKGLPAALLMSNLQAAVRAFATEAAAPEQVCGRVNRLLCKNIASGKFVTFCYVILDLDARQVTYANAGHNPPVLMHDDGTVARLSPTGLVLGVSPDWPYTAGVYPLAAGDRLVCFTDGVTEATAPATDEEFGDERLVAAIRERRTSTSAALNRHVFDAIGRWTDGRPQDDATLVTAAMVG
jgi:sigma-B regulation protein RsbU (phosphoserine phosphatase)